MEDYAQCLVHDRSSGNIKSYVGHVNGSRLRILSSLFALKSVLINLLLKLMLMIAIRLQWTPHETKSSIAGKVPVLFLLVTTKIHGFL